MASSTPGDIPPLVAAGSVGRTVGTPGGAGGAMASPAFGRKRSKTSSIKRPSISSSPPTFTDLPTAQTQNSKKKSKVNLIGFTKHNSYILALLTIAFVIGEVSHFLIGVVSQEMARSLHYGDKSCLQHSNSSQRLGRTNSECDQFNSNDKEWCETHQGCEYLENGQGMKYQVLAGPTFVVVFTISGILMGYLADKTSRPKLLSIAVILYSICGALMGLAQEYWHLVILRMGIAAGEAACRPASCSLIADMFDSSTLGVANGIFSWGVYIGYGLTFLLGNYLGKEVEIFGFEGWRIAFVVGCLPGLIIAILLFFLEDPRKSIKPSPVLVGETNNCNYGTAASNSKDQIKKNRAQCVKILSSFNFLIAGIFYAH